MVSYSQPGQMAGSITAMARSRKPQ